MCHEFQFEVVSIAEVALEPEAPVEQEQPVVLVVDDEPLITDSLAAVLKTIGLKVLKAYDGLSALEVATRQRPDLLLTDVAMPGMNGVDLAMEVAAAVPGCRVLLFSGHASSLDLRDARRGGFDFQLLSKPLHPVEMLRHVSDSLRSEPGHFMQQPGMQWAVAGD